MGETDYKSDELGGQLLDIICKEAKIDRATVSLETTIESLDLKSIDIVMMLSAIEDRYNVYIPMTAAFQSVTTVQNLVDVLVDQVEKAKTG